MNKKSIINILFLGGAKRVSLAEKFIEQGQTKNIDVRISSYELSRDVPIAFVGNIIIGLRWADPEIINHLVDTINENKVDIVLPFVDPSISIAAKLKNACNAFIPVSDFELSEILFDKASANNVFKKKGFPIPSTDIDYPMIAKPRKGSASRGIIKINNKNELDNLLNENAQTYFIQKFISGIEYTVDCYKDINDNIICVIPRIRIDVVNGEVTTSKTENNGLIIKYSESILNDLALKGPVTIQYIVDRKSNKVYLMEINPRLGGGILTSIKAGANIPGYIINDFLGIKNDKLLTWTDNLMMLRTYREFYKICE